MAEIQRYKPQYQEPVKPKVQLDTMKQEISSDQKTIQALSYLTTLGRLGHESDLDELFDGEVQLWEEELLAVYSLVEVANGANIIWVLKPPKKMQMNVNWAQDYKYDVWYNFITKDGKKVSQVDSLKADGFFPLTTTNLKFNYTPQNQLESLDFERPTFSLNQKMVLKRQWPLVTQIDVMRSFTLDNKLTISYNQLAKPELIEQTKVWALSDKMAFEYDDNGSLKTIIYIPTLSLKHISGLSKAGKNGEKMWGMVKWVKMMGEYVAFTALKKMKWVDIVEVTSENGLIQWTKSNLNGSRWTYKEGFSKNAYTSDGQLNQVYLEKDEIGPDDKKALKIEY